MKTQWEIGFPHKRFFYQLQTSTVARYMSSRHQGELSKLQRCGAGEIGSVGKVLGTQAQGPGFEFLALSIIKAGQGNTHL